MSAQREKQGKRSMHPRSRIVRERERARACGTDRRQAKTTIENLLDFFSSLLVPTGIPHGVVAGVRHLRGGVVHQRPPRHPLLCGLHLRAGPTSKKTEKKVSPLCSVCQSFPMLFAQRACALKFFSWLVNFVRFFFFFVSPHAMVKGLRPVWKRRG